MNQNTPSVSNTAPAQVFNPYKNMLKTHTETYAEDLKMFNTETLT